MFTLASIGRCAVVPTRTGVSSRALSGTITAAVTETLPEIVALDKSKLTNHAAVYQYSLTHGDKFWSTLARTRLDWDKDFHTASECDFAKASFKWFLGGRLNASVNCVDRWARTYPDRVALIWERDEPNQAVRITFGELQSLVNRMANVLTHVCGVRPLDRCVLYMPVGPTAVAAMLACARIGAVHSVVFAGFSAQALSQRIQDAQATVVITADQLVRGGRVIGLKQTVDEALRVCPTVSHVLVHSLTGASVDMKRGRDIRLEEELRTASDTCAPVMVDSDHPLFMLYTSGSTGKPKGVVHSTAGYLLYASLTHRLVFDIRPDDVFACVADIGWVTGHTYVVYAPLANGCTTVLFESVPTYPNPARYWQMCAALGVTQFYGSPTAVRSLLAHGDAWPLAHNMNRLRVLGSVGEPINHEAWHWLDRVVGKGRCMLVDTWWQTETGGICMSPCPADPGAHIEPAQAQRPFYGIDPVLMDVRSGESHPNTEMGALCLRRPWPGMARTIYGDHDRFVDVYFRPYPGTYCTGDGAERNTATKYMAITGRLDDVINVSGHRLGTAEIEDVLDQQEDVAESAVVSYPHAVKGEGICAFIILKDDVHHKRAEIIAELKQVVRTNIAAYAVPEWILVVPGLPKTRSGFATTLA